MRRLRPTKRSRRRLRRKTYRQAGGSHSGPKPLLDSADAPAINHTTPVDFNVRFQPNVKANELGPTFTTYQVAHEPYPVWSTPTQPTKYTIVCWDPDAPKKSFLHWMVTNCTTADNSDGKVLASWYPPSPPPGSGEHRYVLGLLKRDGDVTVPPITERNGFSLINFASQNGLTAVAYRGFRVKAADTPPPPQANPNTNGQLPPPQPTV